MTATCCRTSKAEAFGRSPVSKDNDIKRKLSFLVLIFPFIVAHVSMESFGETFARFFCFSFVLTESSVILANQFQQDLACTLQAYEAVHLIDPPVNEYTGGAEDCGRVENILERK